MMADANAILVFGVVVGAIVGIAAWELGDVLARKVLGRYYKVR